jgi:hypothetical protein
MGYCHTAKLEPNHRVIIKPSPLVKGNWNFCCENITIQLGWFIIIGFCNISICSWCVKISFLTCFKRFEITLVNTIFVTSKLFGVSNIIFYTEFKKATRMFLSPIFFFFVTGMFNIANSANYFFTSEYKNTHT